MSLLLVRCWQSYWTKCCVDRNKKFMSLSELISLLWPWHHHRSTAAGTRSQLLLLRATIAANFHSRSTVNKSDLYHTSRTVISYPQSIEVSPSSTPVCWWQASIPMLVNEGVYLTKCINWRIFIVFNLLKPNDIYIFPTAALTSRRYILNIYSTNIHTEYFKHAA